MRKQIITLLALIVGALGSSNAWSADTLDQLLNEVKKARNEMSEENKQRESRFQRERDNQRALLREIQAELSREEQRSNQLTAAFTENEQLLTEMSDNLQVQVGNFGELFGVVRQVAGDTVGIIKSSLISAQYPDRSDVAARLAQIKGLPSIEDLDALRILLFEEMVQSGEVSRFPSTIVTADGRDEQVEVVRVGVHNLITGDRFLTYDTETGSIKELARQPQDRFRAAIDDLFNATPPEIVNS
ncbi:MAG: MotA/TolQ/ExbB proton channel family protein, partial [Gammaproteobacteria bacterium]